MESLVREMQDPENGVPVRSQKLFLTSIPSAFMGESAILHSIFFLSRHAPLSTPRPSLTLILFSIKQNKSQDPLWHSNLETTWQCCPLWTFQIQMLRCSLLLQTANSFAYVPGYDMIEWLMERLCIEDSGEVSICKVDAIRGIRWSTFQLPNFSLQVFAEQVWTGPDEWTCFLSLFFSNWPTAEAIHMANLLCQHGYFFPVGECKNLVVKDDSSLYRFQVSRLLMFPHGAPFNSVTFITSLVPLNAVFFSTKIFFRLFKHFMEEQARELLTWFDISALTEMKCKWRPLHHPIQFNESDWIGSQITKVWPRYSN